MAFNFGGGGGGGFSFGQPASTSTTTPGTTAPTITFGQAATNPAPATGGLFGQKPSGEGAKPGGFGGFGFGSNTTTFGTAPAASSSAPTTSLFGGASNSTPSFGATAGASTPGAGLFGAQSSVTSSFATPASKPAASSGGFSFGAAPSAGSTTPAGTPAPSLFGFSAPPAPAPASAPSIGAFGSSAGSTTPAGAPPATSLFGGGNTNLFSGNAKRESGDGDANGGGKKVAFGGFGALGGTPSGSGTSTPTTSNPPTAPSTLFGGAAATPTVTSAGNSTSTFTPAAPQSLFGAKPINPPPQAPSPLSFAPPSLPGGASSTATATAPSTTVPSLFGGTSTAPAPSKPLFGGAASVSSTGSTSTTAASSTNAAKSLFSAPAPASNVPSTSAPAPLFGAKPAATTSTSSSENSAPPPSSFGATPAAPSWMAPAPKAKPSDVAKTVDLTQSAANKPVGGTPSVATAPTPSMLRGKTLEEIVNNWSVELELRTKDFSAIAGEVREWDKILRKNGDAISDLYTSVLPLSPLQNEISSSLDYVESQQKDLSAILDSYESQIGDLVDQSSSNAGWRSNSGQAEKEREKAYVLATSLSNTLDTTSTSLSSLIQTLNAMSPSVHSGGGSSTQGADSPLTQIAAILNAHLGSLKWIEGTTDTLKKNVRELEGRVGDLSLKNQSSLDGRDGRNGTPVRKGLVTPGSPFARR